MPFLHSKFDGTKVRSWRFHLYLSVQNRKGPAANPTQFRGIQPGAMATSFVAPVQSQARGRDIGSGIIGGACQLSMDDSDHKQNPAKLASSSRGRFCWGLSRQNSEKTGCSSPQNMANMVPHRITKDLFPEASKGRDHDWS